MTGCSPMMNQYFNIKKSHKNAIVFFRLGDFYEMFYEDAILVSRELDLTLTARDCGSDEKAPMCGIPYHSAEAYIGRLLNKGYKVAMCEQTEAAVRKSRNIVKREVTRVITPGTLIEDSMLDESRNNYISSVFMSQTLCGVCFCDVSTGELKVTEFVGENIISKLKNELGKFCPREIIISGKIELFEPLTDFIKNKLNATIELPDEECFKVQNNENMIIKHFGLSSLNMTNLNGKTACVNAVGALIAYLRETQKTGLERLSTIEFYEGSQFMKLDLNTIRNLELAQTMKSNDKKGSLLWVLDCTKTAMGKRLLRSYIEQPLIDINKIHSRHEAVEEFYDNLILREELAEMLTGIHDINRIMTKISYGSANARDLKALASAISKIPDIKQKLCGVHSELLIEINKEIDDLDDIFNMIDPAIEDTPPISLKEGGIIKNGYDKRLDELRHDMKGAKDIIDEIQQAERKKTGITKLKVIYSRIFGYCIEVTNSYKHLVPKSYIRKQTLTGCERYVTEELKAIESRILGARDRSYELEFEIFEDIRKKVSANLIRIEKTSRGIAKLDVIRSFAEVSVNNNYIKPLMTTNDKIILKECRHPVIEVLLNGAVFVSNSAFLDNKNNMVTIITGPNMAGKSTFMRQVALNVLMAQIGCFVPSEFAQIGIVDGIFTRIGASDDLAAGESTFMVEMNEVASIIKSATSKSLLILDEIGRGTSTFDGMSIARAVLEYVANPHRLGAKTLFATHYHELTELEENYKGIKNFNVEVKKQGDDIVFLRRIIPGAADDSHGIEVAKLAGLPETIIKRAKEILHELESESFKKPRVFHKEEYNLAIQNNEPKVNHDVIEKLKNLDLTSITPIESLNILFEIVKTLKGE